jgi:hypothetical protein
MRIQARAMQRVGELLKEIKPAKTGPKLQAGAPPAIRANASGD